MTAAVAVAATATAEVHPMMTHRVVATQGLGLVPVMTPREMTRPVVVIQVLVLRIVMTPQVTILLVVATLEQAVTPQAMILLVVATLEQVETPPVTILLVVVILEPVGTPQVTILLEAATLELATVPLMTTRLVVDTLLLGLLATDPPMTVPLAVGASHTNPLNRGAIPPITAGATQDPPEDGNIQVLEDPPVVQDPATKFEVV